MRLSSSSQPFGAVRPFCLDWHGFLGRAPRLFVVAANSGRRDVVVCRRSLSGPHDSLDSLARPCRGRASASLVVMALSGRAMLSICRRGLLGPRNCLVSWAWPFWAAHRFAHRRGLFGLRDAVVPSLRPFRAARQFGLLARPSGLHDDFLVMAVFGPRNPSSSCALPFGAARRFASLAPPFEAMHQFCSLSRRPRAARLCRFVIVAFRGRATVQFCWHGLLGFHTDFVRRRGYLEPCDAVVLVAAALSGIWFRRRGLSELHVDLARDAVVLVVAAFQAHAIIPFRWRGLLGPHADFVRRCGLLVSRDATVLSSRPFRDHATVQFHGLQVRASPLLIVAVISAARRCRFVVMAFRAARPFSFIGVASRGHAAFWGRATIQFVGTAFWSHASTMLVVRPSRAT